MSRGPRTSGLYSSTHSAGLNFDKGIVQVLSIGLTFLKLGKTRESNRHTNIYETFLLHLKHYRSDLDCVQHFLLGRLRLRLWFVSMMQCFALAAQHLCLCLITCSTICFAVMVSVEWRKQATLLQKQLGTLHCILYYLWFDVCSVYL
jgi:hypothetical protein